jgi:glycosyltransferase involved in cell wall biosynthesis
VESIPYCCNLDSFLAIPRPRTRAGNVRFLYCGQLIPRKGVDLLMRAFCEVAEQHHNVTLTLVGDGPLQSELAAAVPEPLRPQVRFTGFQPVDALPKFFADADVFVIPSRHDGWGVVVNQAVAAGLPVIASDAVGAAADLVAEGKNGYIVPAGETAPLAAAMRLIVSQPDQIDAFSEQSRRRASECTPERNVERWVSLARRVIEEAKSLSSARRSLAKAPQSR